MAIKYLWSGAGGAGTGADWTNAYTTMAVAAAGMAAGDTLYVAQDHSESTAGAVTIAFPGTLASPNLVVCGNRAASPPTALAITAAVASTGSNAITITGHAYFYGVAFSCATTGAVNFTLAGANGNGQFFENCDLIIASAGACALRAGLSTSTGSSMVVLKNCRLKFAATGHTLHNAGMLRIKGGSVIAGGTSPTNFFTATTGGKASDTIVDGFDFSGWSSGLNIMAGGAITQSGQLILRNCKLPGSWSGLPVSTDFTNPGFRVEMWNCSGADVNVAFYSTDYAGSIQYEPTVVMTGGSSDGFTAYSMKMTASANAEYPLCVLRSPEIFVRNNVVGSGRSATVETMHDGAGNLTDKDAWLEVQYLGTSGFPLGAFADDAAASVLATAADQTASTQPWTTTGITTPNAQKFGPVSFTPQEIGDVVGVVCLAKASQVLYVNANLAIA